MLRATLCEVREESEPWCSGIRLDGIPLVALYGIPSARAPDRATFEIEICPIAGAAFRPTMRSREGKPQPPANFFYIKKKNLIEIFDSKFLFSFFFFYEGRNISFAIVELFVITRAVRTVERSVF